MVTRSFLVCCLVVLFGTAGYTWIEGWSPWQSLFFTLVTLTTVGYGDYGLTDAGERFTAVLMVGGIASVSYAVSQFIQYFTSCAMQPERKMIKQASQLNGHHIVCGIGRTGQRVMKLLREEGLEFVVIDPSETLVEQARADGSIALCGDATLDRLLMQAGIQKAASVAAVTSHDAVNAMICLTARALSPTITISARAEGDDSVQKLHRAGANTVINPTRYGGDGVVQSMIRPEVASLLFGSSDGEQKTLQFAELVVSPQNGWIGHEILEFGLANPETVIVGIKGCDGTLTMRPNVKRILCDGDILVIAGCSANVAQLSSQRFAA